jgi:hypothetical protein
LPLTSCSMCRTPAHAPPFGQCECRPYSSEDFTYPTTIPQRWWH